MLFFFPWKRNKNKATQSMTNRMTRTTQTSKNMEKRICCSRTEHSLNEKNNNNKNKIAAGSCANCHNNRRQNLIKVNCRGILNGFCGEEPLPASSDTSGAAPPQLRRFNELLMSQKSFE